MFACIPSLDPAYQNIALACGRGMRRKMKKNKEKYIKIKEHVNKRKKRRI